MANAFHTFTVVSSWAPDNTWRSQGGQGQELRDHYVRVEETLPKDAEGFKVSKKVDFQGYPPGDTIAIVWKTDENGIQSRDDSKGRLWLQAQDKTYDWKKETGGQKQETIPGYKPAPGATNAPRATQRPEPEDQPPISGKSVLSRLVALKAHSFRASYVAYRAIEIEYDEEQEDGSTVHVKRNLTHEEAMELARETHGPTATSVAMRFEREAVVWDFHSPPGEEAPNPPVPLVNGADETDDDRVPF